MTASSVNRDVTSICCASPGPAFRASGASRAGRSRRTLVAGAMAAGLILGGVMAPGTASAADQSLPAGSTLSDPLNNLAAMSGPSTDFWRLSPSSCISCSRRSYRDPLLALQVWGLVRASWTGMCADKGAAPGAKI